MKPLYGTMLLLCVGLAGPAFADDDDDQMRVRVIHAIPGGPPITVTAAGRPVAQGVQYMQITPYQVLPITDNAQLAITTPDGKALGFTGAKELDDDDDDYTILVMPGLQNDPSPMVKVLETDDDDPEDIKAHMTVINASNAVSSVDLGVSGDRIHSGVNPGEADGPDSINPGQQTVTVNDAGRGQSLLSVPMAIEAQRSYTAVVFSPQEVMVVDNSSPMKSLTSRRAGATTSPARSKLYSADPRTSGAGEPAGPK